MGDSLTNLKKSRPSSVISSWCSYSQPLLPRSSAACTQTTYDVRCYIAAPRCQPLPWNVPLYPKSAHEGLVATNNVWSDETSNSRRCQSRIRSGLHPLGEVVDGDQDELMTTGRFRRNLPDDVDTPYWKRPRWSQCVQLWRWHVNEVPMYLTLETSLNKLATIRLHSQPEILGSHDLTS